MLSGNDARSYHMGFLQPERKASRRSFSTWHFSWLWKVILYEQASVGTASSLNKTTACLIVEHLRDAHGAIISLSCELWSHLLSLQPVSSPLFWTTCPKCVSLNEIVQLDALTFNCHMGHFLRYCQLWPQFWILAVGFILRFNVLEMACEVVNPSIMARYDFWKGNFPLLRA